MSPLTPTHVSRRSVQCERSEHVRRRSVEWRRRSVEWRRRRRVWEDDSKV